MPQYRLRCINKSCHEPSMFLVRTPKKGMLVTCRVCKSCNAEYSIVVGAGVPLQVSCAPVAKKLVDA